MVDEAGHCVETGEIGNLMVKGESMALFYLHQYERSRHTFRGEWLFTGDKIIDADGFDRHAGRSDDMLGGGAVGFASGSGRCLDQPSSRLGVCGRRRMRNQWDGQTEGIYSVEGGVSTLERLDPPITATLWNN